MTMIPYLIWTVTIFHYNLVSSKHYYVKYGLIEESSIGKFIGNVVKDSVNLYPYQIYKLSMHNFNTETDSYVTLRNNGDLITKIQIDREKVCDKNLHELCILKFSVHLNNQHWINIDINIIDINDNIPNFKQPLYQFSISETVKIGYEIPLEVAYDLDYGNNSMLHYKIDINNNYFQLIFNQHLNSLFLKIVHKLDYEIEIQRRLVCNLSVCDCGVKQLCSTVGLTINLIDTNDSPPYFINNTYQFYVNQTIEINTNIGQIKAKDDDSGLNGQLRYFIRKNSLYSKYFLITNNGEIILLKSLKDVEVKELELTVYSEDLGVPPLQSSCSVKIILMNSNNMECEISISPSNVLKVMENENLGHEVGWVYVLDKDKGLDGDIICELTRFKAINLPFGLSLENVVDYNRLFKIYVNNSINREVDAVFIFEIQCSDKSTQPKITKSNITILIEDQNEFPPEILNTKMSIAIYENSPLQTSIFRFNLRDKDATNNFTFQLHNFQSSEFIIDQKSGEILINTNLDRETQDFYELPVLIQDYVGNKLKTVETKLSINILDVNDFTPILVGPKQFNISENYINENKKLEIGTLKAFDKDLGMNGTVNYYLTDVIIKNGQQKGAKLKNDNLFQIDSKTGSIFLMRELDREYISAYSLNIELIDSGSNPLFSYEKIVILVTDVNDCAPLWSAEAAEVNATVPWNAVRPVFLLDASDADSGENSNLSYKLLTGTAVVRLHTKTGEIFLTDRVQLGLYELQFQAFDNGKPTVLHSRIFTLHLRIMSASNSPNDFDLWSNQEKEKIDSLIIIVIASATCIVFLCLLSAIVIVRWQRDPTNASGQGTRLGINTGGSILNVDFGSEMKYPNNDDNLHNAEFNQYPNSNGEFGETNYFLGQNNIDKWTVISNEEVKQQYAAALAIPNLYFRSPSVLSQERSLSENRSNHLEMETKPTTICSIFPSAGTYGGGGSGRFVMSAGGNHLGQHQEQMDISSGDSGKGTIDDDSHWIHEHKHGHSTMLNRHVHDNSSTSQALDFSSLQRFVHPHSNIYSHNVDLLANSQMTSPYLPSSTLHTFYPTDPQNSLPQEYQLQ